MKMSLKNKLVVAKNKSGKTIGKQMSGQGSFGKRIISILLTVCMLGSGVLQKDSFSVMAAENVKGAQMVSLPTDYFYEAEGQLEALAQAREILGLVYGCKTVDVKKEGKSSSDTVVTIGSGHSVFVEGMAVSGSMYYPSVWLKVRFYVDETEFAGYIRMNHILSTDARFISWKNNLDPMKLLQDEAVSEENVQTPEEDGLVGEGDVSGNDQVPDSSAPTQDDGSISLWIPEIDEENETTDYLVGASTGYEDIDQFPDSYRERLLNLKAIHPNWYFVRVDTNTGWYEAVEKQASAGRSLVHKSVGDELKGAKYDSSWYFATQEAVAYYLDPRNYLKEDKIFAMEQLTFNDSYHTEAAIVELLKDTFMADDKGNAPGTESTFSSLFWQVGRDLGVSPFHLAARVRQEQGKDGKSGLISGKYKGYEGYYNYFNIGATGAGATTVVVNGLKYAKMMGWTNAALSISGGAKSISSNYILKGQDTLYLEKFNVIAGGFYPVHTHQYMQNLTAPWTEAPNVKTQYEKAGALEQLFAFKIPVFNDMPTYAIDYPKGATDFYISIPGGYQPLVYVNDSPCTTRMQEDGNYLVKPLTASGKVASVYLRDENGKIIRTYLWKLTYSDAGYIIEALGEVDTAAIKKFTPSQTQIKITWKKLENADGYVICRSKNGDDFEAIATTKKTSYTDKNANESGVLYSYYIRGYKMSGEYAGQPSEIKQSCFLAKPKLSGVANTKNSMKLTWAVCPNVEGYLLYRKDGSAGYKKMADIKATTNDMVTKKLTYNDKKSLKSGTKYSYRLYTYKTINGKLLKSATSTTLVNYYLKRPTKLKAVMDEDQEKVKLSWSKVVGATGYYVYRKMDGEKYKKIATVTKATYLDKGYGALEADCSYKVVAIKKVKKKIYSSVASVVVRPEEE